LRGAYSRAKTAIAIGKPRLPRKTDARIALSGGRKDKFVFRKTPPKKRTCWQKRKKLLHSGEKNLAPPVIRGGGALL